MASNTIANFFLLAVTLVFADHTFFLAAIPLVLALIRPAALLASILAIVVVGQLQVGGRISDRAAEKAVIGAGRCWCLNQRKQQASGYYAQFIHVILSMGTGLPVVESE